MSAYAREVRKATQGFQPASQFVGMTESYPDSDHDLLCFEDPLSDSSSTGDSRLERTFAPPRMCAMADGDPPPEVVPSEQTYTPMDHHERTLANAQANGEGPFGPGPPALAASAGGSQLLRCSSPHGTPAGAACAHP